ncbi:transcriptional regulator [Achromobacter sp. SIMBA_011]|uniref:winged helix-turn-helix domain-containing protein n=1 Tax=Achromobacter TaxID=222 RepID=UPI001E57833F|nr:winged helix-turn-helix domain-containing protein [Achromobacter dolens]MCZ8410482.1 transcriptional regulator [Achromobacter dolens]
MHTLRQFQWEVGLCRSPEGLLARLRNEPADVVVLRGTADDLPQLIAALRRAAPSCAVVWQSPEDSAPARIAALDAGAHVCVPPQANIPEWDAVLRNLIRCQHPAADSMPRWRVDGRSRMLAGPAGERLPLTNTERAFFVSLLNAPHQCLPREGFFPDATRDPMDGARRVDVLVSRLRSKARRLNIDLPVLAVRGWGYMLLPQGVPAEHQ